MTLRESAYHRKNQKILPEFQHTFKTHLIPLANTLTPRLAQCHLEQALMSQLPSQLVDWSYTEKIPMCRGVIRRMVGQFCKLFAITGGTIT